MVVVEDVKRKIEEEDVTRNYSYRLVRDEIYVYFGDDKSKIQAYGIEVERQDVINGTVVAIERDSISSISPYRYKVHNLMKILYDNMVSPIHLLDIIGDEVDNCVEDFDYELKNILSC